MTLTLETEEETKMKDKVVTSWSHLYKRRREIYKAYPDFWKIKVKKKIVNIIYETIEEYKQDDVSKICALDVGSNDRVMGEKIKKKYPQFNYESMDIDQEQHHDYYDLDKIDKKFDLVLSFEVIEHIVFDEGIEMLQKVYDLLKPGGKLIVSTPNVFHPNRYWEYSHKVSYRYDELGGILLSLGFKINHIYRIYNDAYFKRLFRLWFAAPLHQYLCVDFAKSILVVAEKPAD